MCYGTRSSLSLASSFVSSYFLLAFFFAMVYPVNSRPPLTRFPLPHFSYLLFVTHLIILPPSFHKFCIHPIAFSPRWLPFSSLHFFSSCFQDFDSSLSTLTFCLSSVALLSYFVFVFSFIFFLCFSPPCERLPAGSHIPLMPFRLCSFFILLFLVFLSSLFTLVFLVFISLLIVRVGIFVLYSFILSVAAQTSSLSGLVCH